MSSYSERQKALIRDALLTYRHYVPGTDEEDISWDKVTAKFYASTDIELGKDTLRQFAEGINKKENPVRYRQLSDDLLDALVGFLSSPKIELMQRDEIKGLKPKGVDAPFRLLRYLDQEIDAARILPPPGLDGTYQCRIAEDKTFSVIDLTLQNAPPEGIIEVTQIQSTFDPDAQKTFDGWSVEKRFYNRRSRIIHAGWAILTPEDNVLFFLKKERGGANLYYFTLASDISHVPDKPITELLLLNHDYPLVPEENEPEISGMLDHAVHEIAKNARLFTRVPAMEKTAAQGSQNA